MQEGQNKTDIGISHQEPQINTRVEYYSTDELKQSKVQSVVSLTSNPHNLLKYFQKYQPSYKHLEMDKLQNSKNLKLKRYKQSVYYGEFINGKRHGMGIMVYDNNRLYQGNWQCDYKHGQGYEKFSNQCIYQGDYINGKPEGVGRYSWPNGEFYEGQWLNGMKQGSGMWKGAKGDSYIGQWKFGKADGYGVHTWINGDKYEGEFKQCLKHGEGIQKFANGDIYKGIYVNGKPCGFGEYYWGNGSYFKGVFKNGLRDGQGVWKRGTGTSDKYEGEYVNDKKCGYGIFTWSSGNVYKGNYQSDARNGFGEMYWSDGSFYKGEWKNGIQNGEGEIYVPSQGYQRGLFQNNILVVPSKQGQLVSAPYASLPQQSSHETKLDPQKTDHYPLRKQTQLSSRLKPTKINFRNRGLSSKNKTRSIDQNISGIQSVTREYPHYSAHQKNNQNKYFQIHNKLNNRQQKFGSVERRSIRARPQIKQRILHSSFYLHKLHNKTNTSINGSRMDVKSKQSVSHDQYRSRNKDIIEEMKIFNKSKINYGRVLHI